MSASKSPMVKWYFVCPAEDIPLREGRCVTFENHRVALFRLGDGNVRAVQNTCPHKEGPLADGMVFGETVTCPLHTRTFDLRTGAGVNEGDGQLRVYPTRIVDGRVLIAFDDIPDRIRPEFVIKSSSYFKVTAVIRSAGWPAAKQALEDIGCTSYARYRVLGRGEQQGLSVQQQQQALVPEMPSGPAADWRHAVAFLPKICVEVIVDRGLLEAVISNLIQSNQTGQPGDGKIFATPLEEALYDPTEPEIVEKITQ